MKKVYVPTNKYFLRQIRHCAPVYKNPVCLCAIKKMIYDLTFDDLSFNESDYFESLHLIPRPQPQPQRNRLDSHGSDVIESDKDDDDCGFDDEGEFGYYIDNGDAQRQSNSPPIPDDVNWGWTTDEDDDIDGVVRNNVPFFIQINNNANNNNGNILPPDLVIIPMDALLPMEDANWLFNQVDDMDEYLDMLHEVITAEMENDRINTITIFDDDDDNDDNENDNEVPNVKCDVIIISDDEE